MMVDLTDVPTIKKLLGEEGAEPARAWGQNFLISPEVVEASMVALQDAPRRATELGSGLGVLTTQLASAGFTVRAIEKDRNLTPILRRVLPPKMRGQVTILEDDLRDVEWSWDEPYVLVGNIPYNLSGLIFRRLTQLEPVPERVVFLVQKEVGERVRAGEPDMSLLSLAVHLWGEVEKILNVPPHCFWPQPKVSSQLVLLTPHARQKISLAERERVMGVAKKIFAGKRKQIGGQIGRIFGLSAEEVTELLSFLDILPMARPQELSVEGWVALAQKLPPVRKEGVSGRVA